MIVLPNPQTLPHEPENVSSPYCSDPDCIYCQDLRAVQAQMEDGKPITSSGKSIAV
jgi:hypothetical protein